MKLKEYEKKLKKEYQNTFKEKHVKYEFHFKLRYAFLTIFGILFIGLLIEHFIVYNYNQDVKRHNQEITRNASSADLENSSKLSTIHTKKDYESLVLNYKNMTNLRSEKTSILSYIFTFQFLSCTSKNYYAPDGGLIPPTYDDSTSKPNDSYQTNVQVEGIDEADVAKCDGKYIYYFYNENLYIYDVKAEKNITSIKDSGEELYIYENRIVSIGDYETRIYKFIDNKIEMIHSIEYQRYLNSRLFNHELYLVYGSKIEEEKIEYEACYYDTCSMPNYLYDIVCFNLESLESKKTQLISEASTILYASKNNFYFASRDNFYDTISSISVFSNELEPVGVIHIGGYILNQFSMDEYEGYFRVVSTDTTKNAEELNAIALYDLSDDLKKVGFLGQGIGKERQTIQSVRFDENTCFVVTYQNKDPLYEIDCSDPTNPVITSAYEAPGYSNYLHAFCIGKKEYVLGLGYTDSGSSTKISVYEKKDGTVQIGKDFVLSVNPFYSKGDYYNETLNLNMFSNHKALFIFEDETYFFLGAKVAKNSYLVFKIDVEGTLVTTIYKEIPLEEETNDCRLFLVEDKIYLTGNAQVWVEEFA